MVILFFGMVLAGIFFGPVVTCLGLCGIAILGVCWLLDPKRIKISIQGR